MHACVSTLPRGLVDTPVVANWLAGESKPSVRHGTDGVIEAAEVPKGEGRFHAQAVDLRNADVRDGLLSESGGGFKLVLDRPESLDSRSPVLDVVRAIAAEW
jgi:hypothetical protein